jgi:hypothetical protein
MVQTILRDQAIGCSPTRRSLRPDTHSTHFAGRGGAASAGLAGDQSGRTSIALTPFFCAASFRYFRVPGFRHVVFGFRFVAEASARLMPIPFVVRKELVKSIP